MSRGLYGLQETEETYLGKFVIKSSKTLPVETYLKSWASLSPISSDQCVRIILEFYGILIQRATVQETPDIYLTSLLVLAHFVLLLLYFAPFR